MRLLEAEHLEAIVAETSGETGLNDFRKLLVYSGFAPSRGPIRPLITSRSESVRPASGRSSSIGFRRTGILLLGLQDRALVGTGVGRAVDGGALAARSFVSRATIKIQLTGSSRREPGQFPSDRLVCRESTCHPPKQTTPRACDSLQVLPYQAGQRRSPGSPSS